MRRVLEKGQKERSPWSLLPMAAAIVVLLAIAFLALANMFFKLVWG